MSTAVGARQYERLQFTDGQPWFKSMIFMYRANHGLEHVGLSTPIDPAFLAAPVR